MSFQTSVQFSPQHFCPQGLLLINSQSKYKGSLPCHPRNVAGFLSSTALSSGDPKVKETHCD